MTQHKIELVKSSRDTYIDIAITVVVGAWLYYTFNPDAFERLKDSLIERFESIAFSYSVWQTRQSIQSLDEIDPDDL